MAKSVRSKVKKKHRSYMRATIGEKVRSANIDAASKRGAAKRAGRENTKTLKFMKGALGAGQVDLGKAYYDAIVRPSQELVPEDEAGDADDAEEDEDDVAMSGDEADGEAPAPTPVATLEEEAACQLSLRTKQEMATAKVKLNRYGNGKLRGGGSGMFSKRGRRRADVTSSRPPKEMVSF